MKKQKLRTWKAIAMKIKVPVELQEDRKLFACMMSMCKSRTEIDTKEAVGAYEFRLVPRSMFAAEGTLLHGPAKSALMHILEMLLRSTIECRIVGLEEKCPK